MDTMTATFKAADLCKIIEQCAKSGVQKLTLEDLQIEFTPSFRPFETEKEIVKEWKAISGEIEEKKEKTPSYDDLALEDLAILDPVAWDKRIYGKEE